MIRRTLEVAMLAGLLVLWSCGDEPAPPGSSDQNNNDDGRDAGDDIDDDQPDVDIPDVDEDSTSDRLGLGERCEENTACESFVCFFQAEAPEGFCSSFCLTAGDCPAEGFDCVFLQNRDMEIAKVCVPVDLCFDKDGDTFGVGPGCAGRDCDEEDATINPEADEICDGRDNDCDNQVDDNPLDANTPCDTGIPGACGQSHSRCISGALVCEAERFGTTEVCDGRDNDCDGQTDEGDDNAPLSLSCYNGPTDTAGVGLCRAGERVCREGVLTDCEGQVLPLPEICDGEDNDCDSETDEENPGGGIACETGGLGLCRPGLTRCAEGQVACEPLTAPEGEACDGVDNDCDGNTDEDDNGRILTRACYDAQDPETEGVGVCRGGTRTCVDGGFGGCVNQVLPTLELCDTVDNDCDGDADEGNPAGGQVCSTGLLGVCARGQTACGDGGVSCLAINRPEAEFCDGEDNDCDGTVDEDVDGEQIGRSCYNGPVGTAGRGLCAEGAQICVAGDFGGCVGEVRPTNERCDGLDNNCDGEVDDGNPGGGLACDLEALGVCRQGQTRCGDDGVVCEGVNVAGAEVCDGEDNDCDGDTDEDEDGLVLALSCYDGTDPRTAGVGVCRAGTRTCVDGDFGVCVNQVLPGTEICDGLDNDCDGDADEGNPAGGQVCSTGLLGVCARGQTACTDDGVICVPSAQAGLEVCDGEDNDCDGVVDEGANGQPIARSCYGGPGGTAGVGICVRGTETCVAGDFGSCVGEIRPGTERCDGVDNDCDNTVDDGNPGGDVSCERDALGICRGGQTRCVGGDLVCEAVNVAGVEVCDGEDNDCDGSTDEDANGQALTRSCYDGPNGTSGVGECRAGTRTCGDGNFGACVGQVLPSTEVCDGDDNDCDGNLNEGNPGGGQVCSTGLLGVCARGQTACSGGSVVCNALVQAGVEVCDGEDDDCDGVVDEGANGQPIARSCYGGPGGTAGVGICVRGTETCVAGDFGSCVGEIRPGVERCDGVDNDCDNVPDDGNPGGGVACATGLAGVCAAGVTVCGQDGSVSCVQTAQAGLEVCDNIDNDCDGDVDEAANGQPLSRTCYDGPNGTANVGICLRGTETCTAGTFGACLNQVLPSTELCDNIDNDCDNTRDDGNPGGGISCSTGQPGICAPGTTVCSGGNVVCSAAQTAQTEICDGIDNDCDSSSDENFTGLGQACEAGLGACRRTGVLICNVNNRSGAPVCTAVPAAPAAQEACDFNDDDCDGSIDETFVNGQGIYNQVANCGGCGINCNNRWPGGPALFNVAPNCTVGGNVAVCGFTCVNGFIDLDRIPENGCEFQPDATAIYVSRPVNGGNDADATCGTFDRPCATIGRGIVRAGATAKVRVRVSDGLYRENITLVNGISLLGGHNASNWQRNPEVFATTIAGQTLTPTGPDRIVITGLDITLATEVSGFTINGENAAAGGNSIAIYLRNPTGNLTVRDNVIFAGNGGNGAAGGAGQSGSGGVGGGNGGNSFITTACATTAGPAGGARTCPNPNGTTTTISGGAGGATNCPVHNTRNGNGGNGLGPVGSTGGLGGGHLLASNTDGRACTVSNGIPADPLPGNPGPAGNDGAGAAAVTNAAGAFDAPSGHWRGVGGTLGTAGQHGSGGAGGGAAPGVDAITVENRRYYGATGGSGGSGGCAAFSGAGGTSGGASFAIFITYTNAGPTAPAQMPRLLSNQLARGQGGIGGDGGNGGAGGDPGLGGRGGLGLDSGNFGFCMIDGAVGAKGGRGGHGGGGAAGAGGVSFDIYVHNNNSHDPGYAANNTFDLANALSTAGPGGRGGNSSNAVNGVGGNGPIGLFGNTRFIP